ncbi:SOS response-associated peptidase [Parasphingorhabdus halotolerans]|uniref:Abasic site processing protein n=1 Tax=Parasphingorhabdus halotolerans TaxID=2725558 RepID=A0A6H2DRZ9_9SPHN|nr:SOS response-associated peptidase [Parasphingorhabdus halotolerans]QJB70436.1 SOS response-associated peptidase [Parasphingorhabdus halotolerans]
MCGRKYATEELNWAEYRDALNILQAPPATNIEPNYNIAPTHYVPVCVSELGKRRLELLQWGLVLTWAKETKLGYSMFNARAETLGEKPSFRNLLKSRRCVAPVSGFYEWKLQGSEKQAHKIELANGRIMMMAGLWAQNGDLGISSYTVVTTSSSDSFSAIHHRMPVILDQGEAIDTWMEADWRTAEKLLNPFAGSLSVLPGSNEVGNVRNNYPELLNAVV